MVALDSVPPGLHHDEACNGYDAYCLLKTGRDHHGNFMPIAIEAFGDYRPPLFDYSLIPLVEALGLKTSAVRMGAAMWGIADLGAMTCLAALMLGWPGAAAAALLGALSPWHLSFSRFGQEAITGSATVTIAMLSFFAWLNWRRTWQLMLTGVFLGLSLYSYSIVKVFTPLIIALVAILYWRELRAAWPKPLMAIGLVVVIASPQIALTLRHSTEMQSRYNQMSLFHFMATCPDCEAAGSSASSDTTIARIANFSANWAGYFSASFLFINGDRGDHWALLHPRGFGQLLPEQAPLIVLALLALASTRRRRLAIFLIGWLAIAAVPAALTVPSGAWQPEAGVAAPTPFVFMKDFVPNVPLTTALLFAHPESRRDVIAIAPWTLLSALGVVVLIEFSLPAVALSAILAMLAGGAIFHGARSAHSYFHDYPIEAAPYFQYGMEQVVADARRLATDNVPTVITNRMEMPYIYVLFYDAYPPEQFQTQPVTYVPGSPGSTLYASVMHFGDYWFGDTKTGFARFPRGVFVFAGDDPVFAPPVALIEYPDGRTAYNIVVK